MTNKQITLPEEVQQYVDLTFTSDQSEDKREFTKMLKNHFFLQRSEILKEMEQVERVILKEFLWRIDSELQNDQAIRDAVKEIIKSQRAKLKKLKGKS